MEKTKKRILGVLGLVLVVIMTIFATLLPNPGASAIETSSVANTVTMRIVGSTPDVEILQPKGESGENLFFVKPNQNLAFRWSEVEDVIISAIYRDRYDEESTHTLYTHYADYEIEDEYVYPINLLEDGFGYGEYIIAIAGTGYGGVQDEDRIKFYFYPVIGVVSEDENDGLIYLDLDYDIENENINTIEINIYDKNGNLVKEISPIRVNSPKTRVELPFSEHSLSAGEYRVEITAYDADGNDLYIPYFTNAYYEPIPVPDTGAPFKNLNISRIDYIITGLLIFIPVAIFGIIFTSKDKKYKKVATKKRRK